MASVALLFVGAVLLINGLVLLDRIEGKAAIPLNLLVGALLMMTALLQVLSVPPSSVDFRSAAFAAVGFTLFGFTYLTVGANSLFGGSGSALGWYCGWAAGISMVLASVNFAGSTDLPMAWLWASWSVLFIAFFLALTTGKKAAGVRRRSSGDPAVRHNHLHTRSDDDQRLLVDCLCDGDCGSPDCGSTRLHCRSRCPHPPAEGGCSVASGALPSFRHAHVPNFRPCVALD